jgi:hypothetical protein
MSIKHTIITIYKSQAFFLIKLHYKHLDFNNNMF